MQNLFRKVAYYLRRYGFFKTMKKCLKRIFHIRENRMTNQEQYQIWMENNEPTETELEAQKKHVFQTNPKISIVVPMYHTPENFFKDLINCMLDQTYPNWELCLADGSPEKNENLKKYYEKDTRIRYQYLNGNLGIAGNTNAAIKMATGDYIGFLDHDDLLAKNCLYEVVKCIQHNEQVDFIYTDEDKIDENQNRFEPYFKPDFSPETLECHNYITHFVVAKKTLIDQVGLLNAELNGAQDFDFVLRATEKAKQIVHISKILYHWRVHKASTANVADAKPYAYEAGKRAIEEHLKRVGKKGIVSEGQDVPGIYKIVYDVIGKPKVTILIPNQDHIELLKPCIDSILKQTTYENYEIVILENNSQKQETFAYYQQIEKDCHVRILNNSENKNADTEFNYASIINFGVEHTEGEFILQLNNDTKLLTPNWLELMVGYAQYKEIGAVGARLYYADKTIQHAGIAYGIGKTAANLLVGLPYDKHAYFGREALTANVSAVTGACLLTRREVYQQVGGMDEKQLKIAFNDVDFCLKILENGYHIVYNPYVELIHYESKSRGYEYSKKQEERFEKESNYFKEKWKERLSKPDPYYNIHFSRETCQFDIETKKG